MDLDALIQSLTPEVYENLKNAVALGRWPNGVPLKEGQRELCLEAIFHYENSHDVPVDQRVGFIADKCASDKGRDDDEPKPISIQ
ncbi:MAG: YeaC family protein [Oceanobacter sp.]